MWDQVYDPNTHEWQQVYMGEPAGTNDTLFDGNEETEISPFAVKILAILAAAIIIAGIAAAVIY